ncbi:MAG: alkaline phosphatase family protein [Candidatus Cybelea sp.]
MSTLPLRRLASLALILGFSGCSGSVALPYMQNGAPLNTLNATGAGKIEHIVYVVQENRSFDNLFQGYPGADTVASGKDSLGHTIRLQPASLSDQYDIDHSAAAMFAACNGNGTLRGTHCTMSGFNNEEYFGGPPGIKLPMYVYVPHSESKPYFDMAHEWVVADRMFQSHLDESFVGHQYIIAAQAQRSVDLPFGLWGCDGGPSDQVATLNPDRTEAIRKRSASITRRSATSSIRPASHGASTRANMAAPPAETEVGGRAIKRLGTSATAPTGRKISSRRSGGSSPTFPPESWQSSPGSRPSATIPIT